MYETSITPNFKSIDVAVFSYSEKGKSKGVVHTYSGEYTMLEHYGQKHLTDAKASAQSRGGNVSSDFFFCTECLSISEKHKQYLRDALGYRFNSIEQITRTHFNPMLAYSGFTEKEPGPDEPAILWRTNSKGAAPSAVDFTIVDDEWNKEGALRRLVDFFSAENLTYKTLSKEGKGKSLVRCVRDAEIWVGKTVEIPLSISERYEYLREFTRAALQTHNVKLQGVALEQSAAG